MSKPFETTFATLRRGAASMEATEAMQQVVKSVYETGKPAKLVIELTVKPNTKNGKTPQRLSDRSVVKFFVR